MTSSIIQSNRSEECDENNVQKISISLIPYLFASAHQKERFETGLQVVSILTEAGHPKNGAFVNAKKDLCKGTTINENNPSVIW